MKSIINTINAGSKVSGQYFGAEFTGTVSHRRCHTVNGDEMVFHIDLDKNIEAMGSERESICLKVMDATATNREFSNCRLYV